MIKFKFNGYSITVQHTEADKFNTNHYFVTYSKPMYPTHIERFFGLTSIDEAITKAKEWAI